MTGNEHQLYVFFAKQHIACIKRLENDALSFQYTAKWQEKGFALSPFLPLSQDIPSANITRFLSNLLPEGEGLETLLSCFHLSKRNIFGLSLALGMDLPGAIIILPSKELPLLETSFRKVSISELGQRLDDREHQSLVVWDNKPRLSVAGVQDKINLLQLANRQIGFGEGDLSSTHILKFEKKQSIHLALNECITLALARHCGLKVATAKLMRFGKHVGLLVERFDRKLVSDNHVKRRHMIDGCQALNLPPEYKYEQNLGSGRDVAQIREGASLEKIFQLATQCITPAQTKLQLIDWVLFNCLTFNFDAHGKNISFFVSKKGLEVTPFYDLVNIAMYPKYDQNLAMALGDEFDGHAINAYQLADFCDVCKLSRSLVAKRLILLGEKMLTVLSILGNEEVLSYSEKEYIKRYRAVVTKQAKHLLGEANTIKKIEL